MLIIVEVVIEIQNETTIAKSATGFGYMAGGLILRL